LQKINDVGHIGKVFLKTTLNKKTISTFKTIWNLRRVWDKSLFKLPKKQKKGIKPFQLNLSLKMVSQETSKLCSELLEINSASQNHLPCRGLENVSKVAVLLKLQMETG
jgi:hypothetical protein